MTSFDKEGTPFAEITGGKHSSQTVYASDKADDAFRYLGIANNAKTSAHA